MEEAGLAVQLASSSQAKNLPGRPKTDKEDARRIARLTETGMLRSYASLLYGYDPEEPAEKPR